MSGTTTPGRDDTPAVALGPLALVLGVVGATGAWPTLALVMLPWSIIASGLALTFGVMGIHYARQGDGRMGTAVAGTTLGAIGLVGVITLITAFAA